MTRKEIWVEGSEPPWDSIQRRTELGPGVDHVPRGGVVGFWKDRSWVLCPVLGFGLYTVESRQSVSRGNWYLSVVHLSFINMQIH